MEESGKVDSLEQLPCLLRKGKALGHHPVAAAIVAGVLAIPGRTLWDARMA